MKLSSKTDIVIWWFNINIHSKIDSRVQWKLISLILYSLSVCVCVLKIVTLIVTSILSCSHFGLVEPRQSFTIYMVTWTAQWKPIFWHRADWQVRMTRKFSIYFTTYSEMRSLSLFTYLREIWALLMLCVSYNKLATSMRVSSSGAVCVCFQKIGCASFVRAMLSVVRGPQRIAVSYLAMIRLYYELHGASCLYLPSHSESRRPSMWCDAMRIPFILILYFVKQSVFFVVHLHNSALVSSIPGCTICLSSLVYAKQTMFSHFFSSFLSLRLLSI